MVGPRKKHVLPLLLLATLLLVYLFNSKYSPETTPAKLQRNPGTTPKQPPNFTFLVKVLAYNRLPSLARCLQSLAAARYPAGDAVHLHVYIDHPPPGSPINESLRILEFADAFPWAHGAKVVHYRTSNAGLQAQWIEAWWPASDHEFAFVVEDDLEVSPLYYQFVKAAILKYYYDASSYSPSVYGLSLQRPRFVPGKHGNKINLDSGTRLFFYQLVGTWGQILFPKPWKDFRLWYDDHKNRDLKPYLDGMVTNGWYKKLGEKIWTPWFIKFIHERGYFNIYTNFHHDRALSVSHRDPGVNYGKTAGPDSQLMVESPHDFDLLALQPSSSMKWYDFCFREVIPGRIARSLDELGLVLPSVQKQHSILLVSIVEASESVTRNLLCHFERLNIRNYILMGPHSDFLLDLARRGHPVVDADHLLNNIREQRLVSFRDSSLKLMKDVLVKAYVVKKCLENGYDSWILNSNMLFPGNDPLDRILHQTSDFFVGNDLEIFFARGSSSNQRIWTGSFLKKVVTAVDKVSTSRDSGMFVHIVGQLLEQNGITIQRIDETSLIVKVGASSPASLEADQKLVYWSADLGLNLIQKRLEELGLWDVDHESSCKAVVCHQT